MDKRKFLISLLALLLVGAMLLGFIVMAIPRASAATSSEIKNQLNELKDQGTEIQNQLDQLEQQLSDNLSEIEAIVAQKNLIDQEISLLHEQVSNINEQISAYNVLIADKQDELDNAKSRLTALNEKNRERIRAMEEDGGLSYWSVLFQANSLADLLDRFSMIEEIAAADKRRLDEMRAVAQQVQDAQNALVAEKAELNAVKAELVAAEAELEDKRVEAEALLTTLLAQGEAYEALIEEGEQRQQDLLQQIAQKESEYTAAQRQEWLDYIATATTAAPTGSGGSSGGGTGGTGGTVNGVTWLVPCSYVYVSSVFQEERMHPILGYVRPHYGIDLAAYLMTPVVATRSGVVTTAAYEEYGAGNYVSINHGDGYSSVYMHLHYSVVKPGDVVGAGQVIGYVGTSGLSEGPHLHFGISYNGKYVNPANYINF